LVFFSTKDAGYCPNHSWKLDASANDYGQKDKKKLPTPSRLAGLPYRLMCTLIPFKVVSTNIAHSLSKGALFNFFFFRIIDDNAPHPGLL